jgi:predicted esterase
MPSKAACVLSLLATTAAIAAPTRVEIPGGYYLVLRPANLPDTAPAALVFCLHGAEQDAAGALDVWERARGERPFTIVALQCPAGAWSADHAAFVQDAWGHVQRHVDHDPLRIVLAGSGAGATLATKLYFVDAFPGVGLALHGGALPADVTVSRLVARLAPVIWTVGVQDPQAGAVDAGVAQMRMAGLSLEFEKVPGGAIPDRPAAEEWITWFEARCRDAIARYGSDVLAAKLTKEPVGSYLFYIEELTSTPGLLPKDQVERLAQLRADIENPAREEFIKVARHVRENDPLAARSLLLELERRFLPMPIGLQALHQRGVLETTTSLAGMLRPGNMAADVTPAKLVWQKVEAARARGRLPTARRLARELMAEHPTSPEADEAEKLLLEMDPNFTPPAAASAP